MPEHSGWLVEDHVIITYLWGYVPLDDVQHNADTVAKLVYQVNAHAPIHIIVDATQHTNPINNFIGVREATRELLNHPDIGWVLIFGYRTSPINQFIVRAVCTVFGIRFRFVDTFDEARLFLQSIDLTLDEDIPDPTPPPGWTGNL